MTEEINQEIGTDITELYADIDVRDIDVPFKGKIWQFKVRSLTWSEKNELISKSAQITKKGKGKGVQASATFSVNTYNQLYLEKAVVDGPIKMTPANLLKLDSDFGDLLVEYLVESTSTVSEEEEGN